jgi:hypothetical protein
MHHFDAEAGLLLISKKGITTIARSHDPAVSNQEFSKEQTKKFVQYLPKET